MNEGAVFVTIIIITLVTTPLWTSFLEGVWKEAKIGEFYSKLEPGSRQAGRNLARWIMKKDVDEIPD